MKKSILILMAGLMLLTSCDGKKPQDNDDSTAPTTQQTDLSKAVSDYFPLKENVHLKYRGEGNEYAEFETYVDYVGKDSIQIRTMNPGTTTVSVYVIQDGALKQVYSEGEEYYRLDRTGLRKEEEILIKEPIKTGTSWTLKDGSKRSITAVDADVEVPYGKQKALEITTEGEFSTVKDYYAPGIGLVKRDFVSKEGDGSTISSELEKVEEGVPYKQTVRFFYPDFNNDRILYLDKEIELYTNDSVGKVFETGMKQVPENSGLVALMSPNAAILGIDFNSETGIATIDFSSNFITDMNAGSSLETMIVSSVADTIGHYFQTDKVSITIEGNAYESGHIAIEKGDYWTADFENVQEYQNQLSLGNTAK